MSAINIAELRKIVLIMAVLLIIAIVIIIPIQLIKKVVKKSRKSSCTNVRPKNGPYISVEYFTDGGIFEDGKCGWLDLECEDGLDETVELNFNKKSPLPIYVPLKIAKYRITYRSKSKAGMAASSVLKAINETSGGMGAFANAVYDKSGMSGQLSSVVVDVTEGFVMKLGCSTDGIEKKCAVLS